jgi:acyl carrier protein
VRTANAWDSTFEGLVRSLLPAATDTALEPDVRLTHYGLTSLGYLELGRALSEHYGIPMSAFTERAFRTIGSLWLFVTDNLLGSADVSRLEDPEAVQ